MTKDQEKQLSKQFEEQFHKQFTRGLLQGSKAMCGVILDKIKSGKNDKDVIKDVKGFCEKSLGLKDIE